MRHALAAILLALAACADGAPAPADERREFDSPPPAALDGYRISGPATHGNLSVYLLHAKNASQDDLGCLTLEEAFKSGAFRITELAQGAEVNELQVENAGDKPVYIQAGDTVKGGQQDRTIAVDFILPPKSGKRTVDAFCVEPGRWTARAGSGGLAAATFEESAAPVATNAQKLAIRLEKDQSKVWAAGEKVNRDLAGPALTRPAGSGGPLSGATFTLTEAKNSYVEAVEDPKVKKMLAERLGALEKTPADQKDAVGAAFCVNGKIQSVEIYPAAGLFRKLWPKLLRSASVEAYSRETDGAPATPPAESELRALLAGMGGQNGKAELRANGQVVRVFDRERAVLFDTEAGGKLLHRQLLTK